MSKPDNGDDLFVDREVLLEPLLVRVSTAARLLDFGRSTIFEMLRTGELERRRVSKTTRVTMESVHRVARAKDEPSLLHTPDTQDNDVCARKPKRVVDKPARSRSQQP